MTDWKFKNGDLPKVVIENTGVEGCHFISVSDDCRPRCHNINGVSRALDGEFDLGKAHPCTNLKAGTLIMVWNDLEEDANLRVFIEYVLDLNKIQVHAISTGSKAQYAHGLPLQKWKDRNLQEACYDSSTLETSD